MAKEKQEQSGFQPHIKENLPFPDILQEGRPNLTYDMIRANLALPIPKEFISGKKAYGKNSNNVIIDYVNVTDLKDFLDSRAGIWTAEIKNTIVIGNELGVVVALSVHTVDGIYTQDGNGIEGLNHSGFGDTFSNAYAQAFRRACEGHGLGRQLWRKHEIREAEFSAQQTNQTQQNRPDVPQSTVNAANAKPSINSPASAASANNSGEKATPKQITYLENICREKGIEVQAAIDSLFPGVGILEISKKNMSLVINKIA